MHEGRDRFGVRVFHDDGVGLRIRHWLPRQGRRHAVGVFAVFLVHRAAGLEARRADRQRACRLGLGPLVRERHAIAFVGLVAHRAAWGHRAQVAGFAGAVGDAVDDAVVVVRHQERTVLGPGQADRARDVGLAAVGQEAGDEGFDGGRPAAREAHPHDLVAGRLGAVPGAAHGHEGIAAVLGREAAAVAEHHLHRRRMGGVAQHHRGAARLPLLLADLAHRSALRVDVAAAVDVRPAVHLAHLDLVDLFLLLVVAEEIDAVVEGPQLAGLGMPVEADGVAQARSEDAALLAVRRDAQDGGVLGIALVAGIAGAAHGEIQHAVRPKGDSAVRVLAGIRQVTHQQFEIAQAAVGLDVGHEQFLDGDEVELVVLDCHAVRAGTVGHFDRRAVGLAVAVRVLQQQHVALVAPADVDVAIRRHRDDAGVLQARGEGRDGKARRRLDAAHALGSGLDLGRLEDVRRGREAGPVTLLGTGGACRHADYHRCCHAFHALVLPRCRVWM